MDQPKLERLLRIMQLLTDKARKNTIDTISESLDVSPRTVYRYLDTFENAGLKLNKSDDGISLSKDSKYFRMISDLAYFNEEEAYIIKRSLEVFDSNSPAILAIKRKLNNIYDFKDVAQLVVKPGRDRVISNLLYSIAEERRVILKNYHSIHTGVVSDRIVEPIAFGVNMVNIFCYELESGKCKYFKIPRIEEVIVEDTEWQYKEFHEKSKVDIFRFSGKTEKPVKLKMSMVAATLLIEEFPLSEQYIKQLSENVFILTCNVYDYQGVGRFVLGLCNEVEVLDSPEFLSFLDEKRSKSKY
ncbi:MAG: WYL domain-containing protein [Bacteroidales bacterium]|nr:WYL domain-containing protein [Bacteroidales bacterium]MDD4293033.1 WYL domain-containing protein [Bacteroidales bacterium]MDD4491124.1 WYL domain-containing protein [Bacteroidales bacterium]